jgi:hypothetical protein
MENWSCLVVLDWISIFHIPLVCWPTFDYNWFKIYLAHIVLGSVFVLKTWHFLSKSVSFPFSNSPFVCLCPLPMQLCLSPKWVVDWSALTSVIIYRWSQLRHDLKPILGLPNVLAGLCTPVFPYSVLCDLPDSPPFCYSPALTHRIQVITKPLSSWIRCAKLEEKCGLFCGPPGGGWGKTLISTDQGQLWLCGATCACTNCCD